MKHRQSWFQIRLDRGSLTTTRFISVADWVRLEADPVRGFTCRTRARENKPYMKNTPNAQP